MAFSDEWLVPTLSTIVTEAQLARVRSEARDAASVWEALVDRRYSTDEQIVQAVAARFHLPVADLSQQDPDVQNALPEQVARRYNVLPIRSTDSHLEVATANPFDMDAEKMLAFVSGREIRMVLYSPGKIREKLDELYRSAEVVSRLLSGITEQHEVTQLAEVPDDYSGSAPRTDAVVLR